MTVTAIRLMLLAPQASVAMAGELAPIIDDHLAEFGLTTPLSVEHFLAQACWESDQFRRFEENLNYSAQRIGQVWPRLMPRAFELAGKPEALANAAYANHNGNGNESSSDGWRFRGRGLFQLTGRGNYHAAGYETSPDDVAQPLGAVLTALGFWKRRGCTDAANSDDVEAVTRLINGSGMQGLAQRRDLTQRAKTILN